MAILALKHVQPGMVLIRDVRDLSGRLLLGEGEVITAKHQKIFCAWGVSEVDVRVAQEVGMPQAPVIPEECLRRKEFLVTAQKQVDDLFHFWGEETALSQELKNYCLILSCRQQMARG